LENGKKPLNPLLPLGTTPLEREKKLNPSLIIFTYNLIPPHSTLEGKKLRPKHITYLHSTNKNYIVDVQFSTCK
jgi:hypothetical protein